jgi:RNA polymerase sigma factor (sigma-70 family)
MTSDLDLLGKFARENSQDAFSEIVRRHLDLVYSAALRQVRSPQLAEEISQSVFADLARNAGKLNSKTMLTAWLYAVTRRTAIDVIRKESRRQLREQIAAEMQNMNATANDWTQIEPLLDDAMAALDETDRAAILLRYFENKNLREVGESLKISDDAAQKRVSRAVERLREFFAKQKIAIGATGLAVLISANAVQSAPIGLAATISAAAVLTGTAVSTSTVIATTKTIAMTALQKTIIGAALAAAVGTGIFEAHQNSKLQNQNQALQQQQAPLTEQIRQLQSALNDATNQLAGLLAENAQLESNSNATELLKLRGEVGVLRQQNAELGEQAQALRNAGSQSSPTFSTNFMSRASWGFAGYATPDAAVQSMLWAKSVGDVQTFLASVTPDITNAMLKSYLKQNSDAARSQFLIDQSQNWSGLQILNEIPLADDEVMVQARLQVQANGKPQQGDMMLVLKEINGEWKYVDEYNNPNFRQLPSN